MKTALKLAACAVMMFAAAYGFSQPAQQLVRVQVSPENTDWTYARGEKIKFDIRVVKNDIPLTDVEVRYEISEDMMAPYDKGTMTLKKGSGTVNAGSLGKPGFVRCRVWAKYGGKEYYGLATAAVEAEKIEPTVQNPGDFDKFWADQKAHLARVPIDPVVTMLPEKCTGTVDVYHVSLKNFNNSRVYGILCVPKGEGKFPGLLQVPGAGIRPYNGDLYGAESGFITLQIGIHGIPVNLAQEVYTSLDRGPLNGYPWIKLDDRDNYYYKRVYLGCIRALDYLCSLPQWDGKNLLVQGGSQGGALSIVTAALDERITGLSASYPAMADMTGYLNGRAGGWPHMFNRDSDKPTKERVETVGYYDVVNFARRVRAPGFYTFGYNDMVCPPTSMYSAYNVIEAPKELMIFEELGHFTYPELAESIWKWLRKAAGKQ